MKTANSFRFGKFRIRSRLKFAKARKVCKQNVRYSTFFPLSLCLSSAPTELISPLLSVVELKT